MMKVLKNLRKLAKTYVTYYYCNQNESISKYIKYLKWIGKKH